MHLQSYKGFFNFDYDDKKDAIYLKVSDLNKEFLYVNSLSQGIGNNDIGLDRGQLGNERIVYFAKAGNKLLLVQPNLRYRATGDNPLEKRSIAGDWIGFQSLFLPEIGIGIHSHFLGLVNSLVMRMA